MQAPEPSPLDLPRSYNAATHFVDRHLVEGRAGRVAFVDDRGSYTYGDLARRVNEVANVLSGLGVRQEQRVMMCLQDTIDFPTVFFGALKVGAVAVPVSTLLTTADYEYLLNDSRAAVLVVSRALHEKLAPVLAGSPLLRHVIVSGGEVEGAIALERAMASAKETFAPARTTRDDVAFWLYSSGSTGAPKGAIHLHSDLVHTAVLYAEGVLGVREDDVMFSAAKLFFAYGLGNAMTFPLHAGATSVLLAERPTPESVMRTLRRHAPTIFYGVPTLFASILADASLDASKGSPRLRASVSAGEALPEDIGLRWRERFGVDIYDGLGSTEMLHIFLCNRPGDVRYGTSGKPVVGYELRLLDDAGRDANDGEIGELWVKGPSAAVAYWNNRAKSLDTFHGPWTRTGDKYSRDEDGYYRYHGRADDMLKVGGIWVSPFEVESALIGHHTVLEAAVTGHTDDDELVKPKAYVVLKDGVLAAPELVEELKAFVKSRLAPYKYPRWIEFVQALPKTATGKIQRFKLRRPHG